MNLVVMNTGTARDPRLPRIPLYFELIPEIIAGPRPNHFNQAGYNFQTRVPVRNEPELENAHSLTGGSVGVRDPRCLKYPEH